MQDLTFILFSLFFSLLFVDVISSQSRNMKLVFGQKNSVMLFKKIISHLYCNNPAYVQRIHLMEQFDLCVYVSTDDISDSPPGQSSPKVALLPPVLKKVPSDKEKEGQGSPQPSPRTFSQEGKKCFSSS